MIQQKSIHKILFIAMLSLASCSYFQRREQVAPTPEPTKAEAPATAAIEKPKQAAAEPEAKEEVKAAAETKTEEPVHNVTEEKKSEPVAKPSEQPAHHASREVGAVPADKALGWLKNGNSRYLSNKLRSDGQGNKDRERLTGGQHPHSIILSCSDSRVPPELIFDQKLGEVFVVRTAGEMLDSSSIASIEYAVAHLGANLIVVMGHDSCGAVKAAFQTLGGGDAGSPYLNNLVKDIHPRIQSFSGKQLSAYGVDESWANVHGVAKDLIDRSAIVREAVESHTLKIAKSVYHLGSGQVEWKE